MLRSRPARSPRVGVPADHGARATDGFVGFSFGVAAELRVDAASDHLGDRYTQTLGAALEVLVLPGLELNLDPRHDGISIPS